jgi:hypothetical protein
MRYISSISNLSIKAWWIFSIPFSSSIEIITGGFPSFPDVACHFLGEQSGSYLVNHQYIFEMKPA